MLTIKTIPVLSRMISKLDVQPILTTLKNADIFSKEDVKDGKLSPEKALELGALLITDIAPQLGSFGEDVPEFAAMYYNISREEAESKDFFVLLTDVIQDEGIRSFFSGALKRKVGAEH